MERLAKTTNQIQSQVVTTDAQKHEIVGAYQEWLVFKKTALSLDQTRFFYVLQAQCSDGRADIKMLRIRYLYEEERNMQRMTAEEWITDKEAVNKKNTKLLPISGKFRRKTIDRKDFLFNKFESLLK
jgi:colicin import membrane protein